MEHGERRVEEGTGVGGDRGGMESEEKVSAARQREYIASRI